MEKNYLLDAIKSTLSKNKVDQLAGIASKNDIDIRDLIDLTFHPEQQIGFRAAWILENVCCINPNRFLPHVAHFLAVFSKQNNLSALRHYTKILAFMSGKKASAEIKSILTDYETDNIVEVVFAWLIDENIPVAVKSHCLNILANLIPKHQWIRAELIDTMEFLVDRESIAFFAKVKQIRKQLKVKS